MINSSQRSEKQKIFFLILALLIFFNTGIASAEEMALNSNKGYDFYHNLNVEDIHFANPKMNSQQTNEQLGNPYTIISIGRLASLVINSEEMFPLAGHDKKTPYLFLGLKIKF